MTREEKFMNEAVALSHLAITDNQGGPFGCVIVKNDVVIGRGNNKVTINNDPTAHAEIVAIRDACKNIGTFKLDGCEIYTSCEPCPMCLAAIYWARAEVIYYANTRKDAAEAGFDDSLIYDEIIQPIDKREISAINLGRENAKEIFLKWMNKTDKNIY